MNQQRAMIAAAAASVMSLALFAAPASAADAKDMEKCFGVAKAGQNDCAQAGVHDCKGHSKTDNDKGDFKMVAAGTCKSMGGSLEAPKKS